MKTITRQELYNKIWSITKNKTAVELGISHAELTRICSENEIPTPSSKYWQQLSWGMDVEKTPLPNPTHNPHITISQEGGGKKQKSKINTINSYSEILDQELIKEQEKKEIKRLQKEALKGKFTIDFTQTYDNWATNVQIVIKTYPVPDILCSRREIILRTKSYFRLQRLSWSEQMDHPDYHKTKLHLAISVGESSYDRSLRIFDTIINILESLGGKMIYEEGSTFVEFGGVKISIHMSERNKRVEIPEAERSWGNRYKYVPSGFIRITLKCRYSDKTVEDTSSTKVEDKLDDIVKKCLELVHDEYEWREYQRQQEILRKQEAEKRRIEEEARLQLERLRNEERGQIRDIFNIIRREFMCNVIDGIMKKFSAIEMSTNHTDLYNKLNKIHHLFNPFRSEPIDGHLSEADIDALAEEFMKGMAQDNPKSRIF